MSKEDPFDIRPIVADAGDIIAAIRVFEHEFKYRDPQAAFSLGTITNEHHAIYPRGVGYCVTLNAVGQAVFVKGRESVLDAMMSAIKQILQKEEQAK